MVSLGNRIVLVRVADADVGRTGTPLGFPVHVAEFRFRVMADVEMSNQDGGMTMDTNRRIIDMTLGELFAAIDEHMAQQVRPVRNVYGIAGIAHLFDCSIPTAQRIKSSGRIDGAISQTGRKIVVNADKAIELFNLSK